MKPPNEHHKMMIQAIQEQLQTVYDPEFPVVDVWTLGLIYDIALDEHSTTVTITMTFTTPACPMGEMIEQLVENAIHDIYPNLLVSIIITFDPLWSPSMIKDEDLQRMFE